LFPGHVVEAPPPSLYHYKTQLCSTNQHYLAKVHKCVKLLLQHVTHLTLLCDFFSQATSLDEAISIVNANEHGNGTAIFTRRQV
jgi:hypothetical protein